MIWLCLAIGAIDVVVLVCWELDWRRIDRERDDLGSRLALADNTASEYANKLLGLWHFLKDEFPDRCPVDGEPAAEAMKLLLSQKDSLRLQGSILKVRTEMLDNARHQLDCAHLLNQMLLEARGRSKAAFDAAMSQRLDDLRLQVFPPPDPNSYHRPPKRPTVKRRKR